jgi:phosphoglycolate phosphatase-like HAD superfamily hydrolase
MTAIPVHDLEAVLFDLDGTLIDTDDVAVEALTVRLRPLARGRAHGLARRFTMAVETPGNAFITAMDWLHLDQPLFRLKSRLGRRDPAVPFTLISGVPEMIAAVGQRYQIGLVTTRSRRDIDRFLEQYPAIGRSVSVTCGADDTRRLKPHPAPVRRAATSLGLPPARCLMVGDTTVDIRSARRAGAWSAGVLCGFGEKAELERAGAHVILGSTANLGEWLAEGG